MDIKKSIKQHGSNISKVAEKMGITQPALSQQINNKTITLEKANQIAHILGCSLSELVAEESDNITLICPHCGKPITLKIVDKPAE